MDNTAPYIAAFFAAIAAILSGWIYSYVRPYSDTVVIEGARGYLSLLFVGWYIVMGSAIITVILAILCKFHVSTNKWVIPNSIMSAAWGVAWLLVMIAEIVIAKKNEACKDIAGDWVNGEYTPTCYQGDFLNMIPTYVVTVIAFLESCIFLNVSAVAYDRNKVRKRLWEPFTIIVGDRVVKLSHDPAVQRAQRREIVEQAGEVMRAERDAWMQEQRELQRALGNTESRGVATQELPDLGDRAARFRQA